MAHLLYRLTHRRYTQRATLRSLHVLGSALEMGCPLDQSLALTAALSDTWGLRETWKRVAHALANGESLSQVMLGRAFQPPFTDRIAALAELGEVQGCLPQALIAAAGNERVDVFASGCPHTGVESEFSARDLCLLGPVPLLAQAIVEQALERRAESIGLFLALPQLMDGERRWVNDAPLIVEPRRATHPSPYRGDPFEPDLLAAGTTVIGFKNGQEWSNALDLHTPIIPSLVRHLLYRARIPYWSGESRTGQFRIEAGDRWHRLSALFAPSARQLALTLYFEPTVTAA